MVRFDKEKLLEENVVVNCKTEEEAENFIRWSNSFCVDKCIHNMFDIYGESTCYEVVSFACICIQKEDYYRSKGSNIISYDDATLENK